MKLVSKGLRYVIALGPEEDMPEGSYFAGNEHDGQVFLTAGQLYGKTGIVAGEPTDGEIPDELRSMVETCVRHYIPEARRAGYMK